MNGPRDRVATLTLNPSVDVACSAEEVFPTHKIRTHDERHDPGGGGINVARVLARLGERVEVVFCAGGASGQHLEELLGERGLDRHRIAIADHTRTALAVHEAKSGREFRFVPDGPCLSDAEWRAALDQFAGSGSPWLVASGSLPRGVPVDFYAQLAARVAGTSSRLVVDTSGQALAAALEAGGLALVKPSQGEFESLVGRKLGTPQAIGEAAQALVSAGRADMIAVTMGHEGAVLAHAGGFVHRPALDVEVRSATGAGDSFVAGMVHGFLRGEEPEGAFRWGMAAGTAAVLSPGTDLARPEDIAALWERLG